MSLAAQVSVSGTMLRREGGAPLFAYAAMVGDRVMQAQVIDLDASNVTVGELLSQLPADKPGGAQ